MATRKNIPTNSRIIKHVPPTMLAWFAQNKRNLLWRENRTPYRVWLAEVMLQQTTVATAAPYFENFLRHFPTTTDLANAPLDDVLNLWQGLGYYSRARNLHKCAKEVVGTYGGQFPETAEELEKLPGIGPYTGAAIACIAFDTPTPVVDGNIERVISRLFAIATPLPKSKKQIFVYAENLTPKKQSGDYAEAMMDLGATICTPKSPKCDICPLYDLCKARHLGKQDVLPKKEKKKPRAEKTGTAYALIAPDGTLLMQKRPENGLLGGLWELPHSGWEEENALPMPLPEDGRHLGQVRHIFTHFGLVLDVRCIHLTTKTPLTKGAWVPPEHLENYAFSTLMRKVLQVALKRENI